MSSQSVTSHKERSRFHQGLYYSPPIPQRHWEEVSTKFFITQGDHNAILGGWLIESLHWLILCLATRVMLLLTLFISILSDPQVVENSMCFEVIIINMRSQTLSSISDGYKDICVWTNDYEYFASTIRI